MTDQTLNCPDVDDVELLCARMISFASHDQRRLSGRIKIADRVKELFKNKYNLFPKDTIRDKNLEAFKEDMRMAAAECLEGEPLSTCSNEADMWLMLVMSDYEIRLVNGRG